ncbi:helix-turn-helix domain-containing protein [Lactococcus lactis]|uniref:helix-turn-helix domain-containing protein n=1 Tax=Lactococcus lactis TaxID=1358 RepID=UPI0014561D4F|nr:helix-turn-helix transcriptional regulator [Lactococcus lactis]MCC4121164.1 helix-turn-helix domain-containing protein [Lactococcus lactis]MCT0437948.1 XRE family transcriptional regulator [Lactococcus lactis subsp. lactis]MCT2920872.1 XRE family transcriptional regulator [Lactococcus lactis]NLS47971.1 helix-turn-helix domain-containing protein [Lactococcus lactis]WDA69108.1 helix-turn-helix transcriptional regulator [Lactococcus lactis]
MSVFAEQLKTLRKINGLTQKELAENVGVQQGAINKWESGKTEPNIEILGRLADYFDVSIDYLLGRKKKEI